MKKTVRLSLLILMIFASSVYAEKIMNNNVSVRTMPGAFYPIVTILNSGDEVLLLETKDPWKKVKTANGNAGWISGNAFNAIGNAIDYGTMAKENPQRSISKIMVTAAVKGFFENKINDKNLNKAVLDNPSNSYILPSQYNQFLAETYKGRWSREKFERKNSISQEGAFKIDENLVALSCYICARLAAPGLSQNQGLVQYVNNVAQLIMENTEFYDLPITVHIVKTDEIFANATPIGVIMISEGMLKTIRNESELACLLGHEISHVTLHHGAAEFDKRRPKFAAEDAFDEMGDELGVDEVEKELDEMCNDMYERAIRGRKAEYEAAADERGIVYARRAGYKVSGMVSLLERLKTRIPASREPEDASHWLPNAMDKRVKTLDATISKNFKDNKNYETFQARYQQNIR
ncbi:MAG: M48 family metalloprotease [Proteobacteria bacterium]|nr:M48 family metalloprotease [Pseudomonadota bacterium]